MPCNSDILKHVPFFGLLDDEELALLAAHVDLKTFSPRQRIYKAGDPGRVAYVMVSGTVRVTTIDEDQQDVLISEPGPGELFGFASMLNEAPHQTSAVAVAATECIEIDRTDIGVLLQRKPMAGLDLLTALSRHFHVAQDLVRLRSARNANEIIEGESSWADRLADSVARFGGSWAFIITCGVLLVVYTGINILLRGRAWDPYPFILLNLFLSMLAAIQAPVIMMSQNRQDAKDRLRSELDYDVNRRSESEVQGLSRKLNGLNERLADVEDLLRSLATEK